MTLKSITSSIILILLSCLFTCNLYSQNERLFKPIEWEIVKFGIGPKSAALATELRFNLNEKISFSGRFELAGRNAFITSASLFCDTYTFENSATRFFGGIGIGTGTAYRGYVDCEGDECSSIPLFYIIPRFGYDFNYIRIVLEANITKFDYTYLNLGAAFTLGGKYISKKI